MTQRLSEAQLLHSERGAILLVSIFVSAALLALVALAVDVGNLYRTQQLIQKAADAGALAGVGYSILKGRGTLSEEAGGSEPDKIGAYLAQKATEIVRANLSHAGIDVDNSMSPVSVEATYEQAPGEGSVFALNVVVTYLLDFLLIDRVPFSVFGTSISSHNKMLTSRATSVRKIAHVSLILDSSSSMRCPAEGDCSCMGPNRQGPCPTPSREDKVLEAVEEFLSNFELGEDKLEFVPYNFRAEVFRIRDVVEDSDTQEQKIEKVIARLRNPLGPRGNTNICDAFMRAHQSIREDAPVEELAYVFFSDGPPTAGRFLFTSPRVSLKRWDPAPIGDGQYDYTHYTMEWVSRSVFDGGNSAEFHPGPSVLVQTNLIPFNYDQAYPPAGGDGVTTPQIADCGPESAPAVRSDAEMEGAATQVFAPCLMDLGFHMPGDTSTVAGAGNLFDPSYPDWRKQYYHCAIELSDFMRDDSGTIYVIGLGMPAPVTEADPYQDIGDIASRKDVFLSRIANDYVKAVLKPEGGGGQAHPEFNYGRYRSYEAWNTSSEPRRGEYLPAPTSNELKNLFRTLGRRLVLSLVE